MKHLSDHMEEVGSLPCGGCCRAYGVSCCDGSKAILISTFASFFNVNNLLASVIFCKVHKHCCVSVELEFVLRLLPSSPLIIQDWNC